MAATLTPSQMAEHVDLSLDTFRYCEPMALLPTHTTNRVIRIAEPGHNLEQLGGKLAYCADTFGVAAGEPAS